MMFNADMSPAFDAIPGLKDIVPRECGGNNKLSFDEICGEFKLTRLVVLSLLLMQSIQTESEIIHLN